MPSQGAPTVVSPPIPSFMDNSDMAQHLGNYSYIGDGLLPDKASMSQAGSGSQPAPPLLPVTLSCEGRSQYTAVLPVIVLTCPHQNTAKAWPSAWEMFSEPKADKVAQPQTSSTRGAAQLKTEDGLERAGPPTRRLKTAPTWQYSQILASHCDRQRLCSLSMSLRICQKHGRRGG